MFVGKNRANKLPDIRISTRALIFLSRTGHIENRCTYRLPAWSRFWLPDAWGWFVVIRGRKPSG